jgi:putative transposase
MHSTYSQIYIHIVFAVKFRQSLIGEEWEGRLFQYITGIVENNGQKMLAINGMPDHIHFFIWMKPTCILPDLVREVKKSSTAFIKENHLSKSKFQWQEGYGAFSYGHSQVDKVISYIMGQKGHHKKSTFRDEYVELLKRFNIDFEEKYLFDWNQ